MAVRHKKHGKQRSVSRPTPRRSGRADIRERLLDAAEGLFRAEGYAAATARRIAGRIGLKHQVVFYYFKSHDDLLLALLRRQTQSYRESLLAAVQSERPIRAMWELVRDPHATRLGLEFMALANHNDAIRQEIAASAESLRALEAHGIAQHLAGRGIQPRLSPELVSILTNALARLLVQESTLGIHAGHSEAESLVDDSLRLFEASGATGAAVRPIVDAMSATAQGGAPAAAGSDHVVEST